MIIGKNALGEPASPMAVWSAATTSPPPIPLPPPSAEAVPRGRRSSVPSLRTSSGLLRDSSDAARKPASGAVVELRSIMRGAAGSSERLAAAPASRERSRSSNMLMYTERPRQQRRQLFLEAAGTLAGGGEEEALTPRRAAQRQQSPSAIRRYRSRSTISGALPAPASVPGPAAGGVAAAAQEFAESRVVLRRNGSTPRISEAGAGDGERAAVGAAARQRRRSSSTTGGVDDVNLRPLAIKKAASRSSISSVAGGTAADATVNNAVAPQLPLRRASAPFIALLGPLPSAALRSTPGSTRALAVQSSANDLGSPRSDNADDACEEQNPGEDKVALLISSSFIMGFLYASRAVDATQLAAIQRATAEHFHALEENGLLHSKSTSGSNNGGAATAVALRYSYNHYVDVFRVLMAHGGNLFTKGRWLTRSRTWRLVLLMVRRIHGVTPRSSLTCTELVFGIIYCVGDRQHQTLLVVSVPI